MSAAPHTAVADPARTAARAGFTAGLTVGARPALAHLVPVRAVAGRIGNAVLHPYRPTAVQSMRACVNDRRRAPLNATALAPALADT